MWPNYYKKNRQIQEFEIFFRNTFNAKKNIIILYLKKKVLYLKYFLFFCSQRKYLFIFFVNLKQMCCIFNTLFHMEHLWMTNSIRYTEATTVSLMIP